MIIKKFQAKTEREAIETAKKELGENIVIMNVKQIKKKGFMGLFGSLMMEVTVAQETEQERKQQVKAPVKKETPAPIVPSSLWEKKEEPLTVKKEWEGMDDTGKAIVEKLDGLQLLLQQQLNKTEMKETEEEGKKEEQESKEILAFMKLLYNTMIHNEVLEKYANELIDDVQKKGKPDMQMDVALSNIYQKMILKFGQAKLIEPSENKPKLIYFVGPTGVGKTTTIAKLSSKFAIEEKKKIALLTADTYRIAAAEQLRTYANILEVPFRVVYTPEEILQAVEEFKEMDYILIDTAGHSHHNEDLRNGIRDFITATDDSIEKEVYLVVSATTKYSDLVQIADSYKDVHQFQLIFTKLDETTALGNLYNLHLHTNAPLSYVTCGQNVPNDISSFNPQTTVKQILSSN